MKSFHAVTLVLAVIVFTLFSTSVFSEDVPKGIIDKDNVNRDDMG